MTDLLGIVPARAGSQGVKNKNMQLLAGKPLFLHAADTLNQFCSRVIVATDDPTIASVARIWGYQVHDRLPVDERQPIVDVAREVVAALSSVGAVVLLQPTVPPTFDVERWVRQCWIGEHAGAPFTSVVAGTPAGHIMWGSTFDVIGERQNRQAFNGYPMREIGLYFWAGDVMEPHGIVPIDDGPVFDIDTPADLTAARQHMDRKTILLRYVADEQRGMGHVRRMLTLAEALQHHRIVFHGGDEKTFSTEWPQTITAAGWHHTLKPAVNRTADLVITDTLDNDTRPTDGPWVTFEDRGNASPQADLTINALYGRHGWRNERYGPDWFIQRHEFTHLPPFEVTDKGRVLVMFGGTDPANLITLAENALRNASGFTRTTYVGVKARIPVAGPSSIAELMLSNDLLITSAGRTVYEAATVGIPAIVLAQNNREATHIHLDSHHGNIYMGLGRLVTVERLRHTVEQVLGDRTLREELSGTARRSVDGKGLDRVVNEIERILEGR